MKYCQTLAMRQTDEDFYEFFAKVNIQAESLKAYDIRVSGAGAFHEAVILYLQETEA